MSEFSTLSYAAISVFYALLTILLLTSWRGHRIGAFLIIASVSSVVWGAVLALAAAGALSNVPLVFAVEVMRGGAWITFLVVLTAQVGISKLIRYASIAAWIIVLLTGAVLYLMQPWYAADERVTDVLIPGGLVIALIGLVLIEQLYRNSPHDARWGLKALVLGLGGLFAYDLFLYSQAMLFGALDSNTWLARGAVNILFVPLIAIAARRNPTWDLDIFVSRHVVFYSTTLIAVGIYLVLMSLGGYALVLFGGSWGALAQVVFFVGALLVLAFLLFSSTLRARLRVFLSKHFFRNKYDYRDEWLRLVSTLSEFEDSSTREVVIKALCQIVGSPSGVLWLLDENDSKYRHSASFETDEVPPDIATSEPFVRFMASQSWLIDLDEYKAEPDIYENLELPDWLLDDPAAWLIVPLMVQKALVGLVLVNRPQATPDLNYEDRDLLKTVGSHIAVHLAQEKSDNLLTEARQFEAYNRLTAFLMHDLNNLIAQQSLIVANAEKHKRNPEFVDDAINTIAGSVERMKRVMRNLKSGGTQNVRKPTELKFIVSAAVDRCAGSRPVPSLELNGVNAEIAVDAEEFTMVLAHIIRNAQDACEDDGQVRVSLEQGKESVVITVTDNGAGMSADFIRERLFRPFDSTKGARGMGIGAYQAREFARGLGGELHVISEAKTGTTVTMIVPVKSDSPE